MCRQADVDKGLKHSLPGPIVVDVQHTTVAVRRTITSSRPPVYESLEIGTGEFRYPLVRLAPPRTAAMNMHGTTKLPPRSVPVPGSVDHDSRVIVYLHPFPGPPVRGVGIVDESTVSLADVAHSGVFIGGRFVDKTPEKSMEVVPVVFVAEYVGTVARLCSCSTTYSSCPCWASQTCPYRRSSPHTAQLC